MIKKNIVKIKGDKHGVWCNVNGNVKELLTAHFALTENVLQVLEQEDEQEAIKFLIEDAEKLFEKFKNKEAKND